MVLLWGLFWLPAAAAEPGKRWALTVYGGAATDGGIERMPGISAHFTDAYLLAVAPSRELKALGSRMVLETEVQAATYFKDDDHSELNGLILLRWLPFPWDPYLDTSFAVGEGVSWASAVPEIEKLRSPRNTSRFLNYLLVEWEFRAPGARHWSVVARLHHRSGILGIYNGVSRGSNALAAGIKYRF